MATEQTNVKKPRMIPQQLSMSESAPVCQHYSYASPHPMKDVLTSSYFLSAHDRLRPGDTIRVVQMKGANIHARDNEVLSFAEVTIIKVGKIAIDMTIDRLVIIGQETESAKPEYVGEGGGDTAVGLTIEHLNQFSEEINEKIGELAVDKNAIGVINETIALMQESLSELKEVVTAPPELVETHDPKLPEGGEAPKPYRKWNASKGEHQAVVGEGDDVKVLFSHKNKDEVESWLQKSESSTAQEGK